MRAQAEVPSAHRSDIHEGAAVKTRARRVRDFPDIHSASSAKAERHETLCGCSHSRRRRRSAPCRTPGCNLGPALDLDSDPAQPRLPRYSLPAGPRGPSPLGVCPDGCPLLYLTAPRRSARRPVRPRAPPDTRLQRGRGRAGRRGPESCQPSPQDWGPHCGRSWSRSGRRSCRTRSTSCSSWRRRRCPAGCSRRLWSGSGGCGWRVPRGKVRGAGQNGPNVVPVRPKCAAHADFGG